MKEEGGNVKRNEFVRGESLPGNHVTRTCIRPGGSAFVSEIAATSWTSAERTIFAKRPTKHALPDLGGARSLISAVRINNLVVIVPINRNGIRCAPGIEILSGFGRACSGYSRAGIVCVFCL